mmetsp:Transcript_9491/g.30322  ORF Transcript_9491/g.30322 Transcript_9491/m.30322 type:complete len:206 (+) Transcript_9491:368-985(+)
MSWKPATRARSCARCFSKTASRILASRKRSRLRASTTVSEPLGSRSTFSSFPERREILSTAKVRQRSSRRWSWLARASSLVREPQSSSSMSCRSSKTTGSPTRSLRILTLSGASRQPECVSKRSFASARPTKRYSASRSLISSGAASTTSYEPSAARAKRAFSSAKAPRSVSRQNSRERPPASRPDSWWNLTNQAMRHARLESFL